jgi:hypothetical protein
MYDSVIYRQSSRSFLQEGVRGNPAFLQKSGFPRILASVPSSAGSPADFSLLNTGHPLLFQH